MQRRKAVIVSLNGGIGNQLFQYAAGVALAQQRAVPLEVLPAQAVANRALGVADLVDLPAPALSPRERFLCNVGRDPIARLPAGARRATRAAGRRAFAYQLLHQNLMQMADPAAPVEGNARYLHLRGLFQHPSYYEPVLDGIVHAMVCKLGERLDARAGEGRVAVHFRRGDYVLHGYDVPLSFQQEGLDAIAAQFPVTTVDVMSDDHDFALLAAEHFRSRGFDAHTVTRGPNGSELDDFCLLAAAQHVVMSNSTFVWWAAVIGDRLRPSGRAVVCPTPWMPMSAAKTIPSATLDLSRAHWWLRRVST